MNIKCRILLLLSVPLSLNSVEALSASAEKVRVRLGYFPNLTHAQALVGLADGSLRKALGPEVELVPVAFNAGPSAVEALFAGELDLTYVGPNPAVNAFIRSKGAFLVVAGACSGGARLVVRKGVVIRSAADFAGKKLATPQLGNTQDVAARRWLASNGLTPLEKGGTVQVIPVKSADQLLLFQKGEIDAAWAVEPWASRLVRETGATEFLDERSLWPEKRFATTVLVSSQEFADKHPDLLKKFLAAHVELTSWVRAHPGEAQKMVNGELVRSQGKPLDETVLADAWRGIEITHDPVAASVKTSAEHAFALGYLGKVKPELGGLMRLGPLNEVLKDRKLPTVKE